MKRVPGYERLRQLPALFRGGELTLGQGMSSATASQTLWRWKQAELVEPLGGKADVFANLLVAPHPDWDAAVRMAMPSSIIVGIEALRRAGWTTQIPARPEVAVRADHVTYLAIDRFQVLPRSADWFAAIEPGVQRPIANSAGLLAPAWALADLLARDGWEACGLAPEDIEVDAVEASDRHAWNAACEAFGLPGDDIEDAFEWTAPRGMRGPGVG